MFVSDQIVALAYSLSTVLYVSARARQEDFSSRQLQSDLHQLDQDNNNDEGADERRVPLLAEEERAAEEVQDIEEVAVEPLLVDSVILVDAKEVPVEVPVEVPQASEVV